VQEQNYLIDLATGLGEKVAYLSEKIGMWHVSCILKLIENAERLSFIY